MTFPPHLFPLFILPHHSTAAARPSLLIRWPVSHFPWINLLNTVHAGSITILRQLWTLDESKPNIQFIFAFLQRLRGEISASLAARWTARLTSYLEKFSVVQPVFRAPERTLRALAILNLKSKLQQNNELSAVARVVERFNPPGSFSQHLQWFWAEIFGPECEHYHSFKRRVTSAATWGVNTWTQHTIQWILRSL